MRGYGDTQGQMQGAQITPPVPAFYWYLPRSLWPLQKQWFTYNAVFTGTNVATANAATPVTVTVNSDSHYIILGALFTAYQTNDTTPLTTFPALVQVKDTTSGQDFQDQAVDILNFAGTQQLNQGTFWWEHPRFIRGGSALVVTLTNREGTNRNYRITFRGFKIFNRQIDQETGF